MVDIDNNKLIGLLIITGLVLLLSQEHIKERRKQREHVRPWIRKRDSKGAYCSIINDLRLTDKEDFRKYRFSTVKVDTVYQSSLQLMFACLILYN